MTKLTYWILGLLMAVLGWVYAGNYAKLADIEKSLIAIQLDLVKIQAQMMDREAVKELIRDEFEKHGIK